MPLKANSGKSFIGSYVLGMGFVLTTEQAEELITRDPRNKEIIFPYLNGEDLNNDPEQKASRWIINFFDWPEDKARSYSDCFDIVERLVKPERQRWKLDENGNEVKGIYALRKPLPQKWWIYAEKRPALYKTISQLDQVMVLPRVSKYFLVSIVSKNIVYSEATVVLALDSFTHYGILSSSIHEVWAWKNSSTMKGDALRYSASQAFETFPFCHQTLPELEQLACRLNMLRKELMLRYKVGLTGLMNLYHKNNISSSADYFQDIMSLRELNKEIDIAVRDAYGWSDIDLVHDFYDINYLPENDRIRYTLHPAARKEILKRLLMLNHKIHIEEEKEQPLTKIKGTRKETVSGVDLFSVE